VDLNLLIVANFDCSRRVTLALLVRREPNLERDFGEKDLCGLARGQAI